MSPMLESLRYLFTLALLRFILFGSSTPRADTSPELPNAIDTAMSTKPSECKKPAWCQSEEANKAAEEIAEINDEADLLDFVDNLDFDSYSRDLELQILMSQVKERIKTLTKEKKKDETKLQTCVDVSAVMIMCLCLLKWNCSLTLSICMKE